jgi:hypothetical protein
MSEVLTDLSPSRVVMAIEANLQACFGSFLHLPNARLQDDPELFSVLTDVLDGFVNGIMRARFRADDVHTRIERAIQPFKAKAVPFRWWITSSTHPPDLGTLLVLQL